MGKIWGLVATMFLGWFLYENVPLKLWIEVGWWLVMGLGALVVLSVLIGLLRRRRMERLEGDYERQRARMEKHWGADKHVKPVAPVMVYMQPPVPSQYQQPIPAPVGLVNLPLEKYEWEV